MSSRSITYPRDFETPAPQAVPASIAGKLAALARGFRANGVWHDIRALASRTRRHGGAAAQPWSLLAWLARVAVRSARAIAEEARVRRDTRELSVMSDHMLKDVGLTRAEIGVAARYSRN